MITVRMARNLMFIVMLAITVMASETGVLAMGASLGEACDPEEYTCECNIGNGFPPGWEASGNCDFSEANDPEQEGGAFCNGIYDACDEDCGEPYAEYVANYYSAYMNPSDPCYSAATDPDSYITWGNGSCNAGGFTTWWCSCQFFFFAEC